MTKDKAIAALIFTFCLGTIAFLIWSNNKGLDITDEGFYLLSSQFPLDIKIWPNVAYIYTALMYHAVGQNIIELRLLGEILLISSASLFFWGWYRLILLFYPLDNFRLNFRISTWSLIALGALLYYVYFLITPSYDLLNSFALTSAAGFLCLSLAYLSKHSAKLTSALLTSFVAGLFIGLALLVKFPTAVLLLLLFSFVLFFWPLQQHWITRLLNIIMLGLGTASWVLLHILLLQPWSLLWHIISSGIVFVTFMGSGHNVIPSLQRYCLECFYLIITVFKKFWLPYLILLLGLLIPRKYLSTLFITLFCIMGLLSFTYGFYKGGYFSSHPCNLMEFYTAWILLLAFPVISLITNWNTVAKKRLLLTSMLFLALPFAGAIGTANAITTNTIISMAPWLGLIELLLIVLAMSCTNKWIFLSGTLIISLFTCSEIISAGLISPYLLNGNILQQTVPTAIGFPSTQLKLDPATSNFFNQMHQIAKNHGFKPGDNILAFSNMPGIVFALGGRSPIVPWYTSDYLHSRLANEMLLHQMAPNKLKKAFILQNESGENGFPDLAKFGIKFPTDYVLCGQATWPRTGEWVRLWKPKHLS